MCIYAYYTQICQIFVYYASMFEVHFGTLTVITVPTYISLANPRLAMIELHTICSSLAYQYPEIIEFD